MISIDTKAKEKLGDFIRSGVEYRKKRCPSRVLDHDFAFSFKEIYPEGNSRLTDDMLKGIAVIVLFYMGYTVSITTPVTQ